MAPTILPVALALLVCLSAVVIKADEHWAMAGCTTLTTGDNSQYIQHADVCTACVDATKAHGDPTRCHQCLRPHHGQMPADLIDACLSCVPTAEHKRLGWACAQYCTHHGIVQNGAQAGDCQDCLMSDNPTDKWGCHVCMEQVIHNMTARRDCYSCLKEGKHNMYHCAACSRVTDVTGRKQCFECMNSEAMNGNGKQCASLHGVNEWTKEDMGTAVSGN